MTDPALKAAVERDRYLLMKRGLYYRPDAIGYTGIRENAGVYTKTQAESHVDPISGVTMIAEADAPLIAPKCFDDIAVKYLLEQLAIREAALSSQASVMEAMAAELADRRKNDNRPRR